MAKKITATDSQIFLWGKKQAIISTLKPRTIRLIVLLLFVSMFNTGKSQSRFSLLQSQIKSFSQKKNLDARFCFLLDLQMHNGKKRFFIYDIQKDSILHAGLLTHGDCREQ